MDSTGKLVVALDHHFTRVGDVVLTDLAFDLAYWEQYLDYFESVTVFARVATARDAPCASVRASGPRIEFVDQSDFVGPSGLVRNSVSLLLGAWNVSRRRSAFLLRNGTMSTLLWLCLCVRHKSYGREVQGHMAASIQSWDGMRSRVGRYAKGPLAACADALSRVQIRHATATAYVSEGLRRAYPARYPSSEYVFSGVQLGREAVAAPRDLGFFQAGQSSGWELVTVGRLESEKGPDILVESLGLLRDHRPGLNWRMTFLGPGSMRDSLERRVAELDLSDRVLFAGQVSPGPAVANYLDRSHLFVLPSRTEGMPRAMIEGMARGLPAVGTRAGGIVELLPDDATAPINDPHSLAVAIERSLVPARLVERSASGHAYVVDKFSDSRMREAKHAFWSALRGATS